MIRNFRDKDTARVFAGRRAKKIPADVAERAAVKMAVLDQVQTVDEMAVPPSNRLHKLGGDREGQWSVSVNRQWRLLFGFDEDAGDAFDVEISKHYEWRR